MPLEHGWIGLHCTTCFRLNITVNLPMHKYQTKAYLTYEENKIVIEQKAIRYKVDIYKESLNIHILI